MALNLVHDYAVASSHRVVYLFWQRKDYAGSLGSAHTNLRFITISICNSNGEIFMEYFYIINVYVDYQESLVEPVYVVCCR